MNRTKLRGALAGVSIAVVVGVAGIAVAAFTQQATIEKVQGGTATFKPLTLTGAAGDTTLFPNQKTSVTLTISNKGNDVPIVVTEIVPAELTAADISMATKGDVEHCKSMLTLTGVTPSYRVEANDSRTVVLANAIGLSENADDSCQGMTFSTKWTVFAQTAE